MQSQVRFNRNPEKLPGRFDTKPSQVQLGSGESSRKDYGAFGVESIEVQ